MEDALEDVELEALEDTLEDVEDGPEDVEDDLEDVEDALEADEDALTVEDALVVKVLEVLLDAVTGRVDADTKIVERDEDDTLETIGHRDGVIVGDAVEVKMVVYEMPYPLLDPPTMQSG